MNLMMKKKESGITVRRRVFKNIFAQSAICFGLMVVLISSSGCEPSFPKEKLPEAVKFVCKDEYDMDVDVTVKGRTMGIYYPMEGLLDAGLGISSEAWDTISNLLLIASRVVLSTDADIKFYCVIAQDARLPELQVVIIKYVEDVKLGMYRNISRGESFKRTLFTINLTPQAKKERSIEKIFDNFSVGEKTRQGVMDDFFRSAPTRLSDTGYWRGKFYLKDVTMEEFLAAQIANRVKLGFRGEEDLKKLFKYENVESNFISTDEVKAFLVKFKISDHGASENEKNAQQRKIEEIVRIANQVVCGYKFKKFDFLMMEDQLENANLKVMEQDVFNFSRKKLSVKEVVQAPPGYFG